MQGCAHVISLQSGNQLGRTNRALRVRGHSGGVLGDPEHIFVTEEVHIQRQVLAWLKHGHGAGVEPLVDLRVPIGEREAAGIAVIGSRIIHKLIQHIRVGRIPAIVSGEAVEGAAAP